MAMTDEKEKEEYPVQRGGEGRELLPSGPKAPASSSAQSYTSSPLVPILSYCASSILMTVTNKYVLSGTDFNLNFFLLCVQVRISYLALSMRRD